jgi:hypothetical protein
VLLDQKKTGLLVTQNVRGFKATEGIRQLWMQQWKTKLNQKQQHYIFIQETHINTTQEAQDMEAAWCRVWGLTWQDKHRYSFWSTHHKKNGGGCNTAASTPRLNQVYKDRRSMERGTNDWN